MPLAALGALLVLVGGMAVLLGARPLYAAGYVLAAAGVGAWWVSRTAWPRLHVSRRVSVSHLRFQETAEVTVSLAHGGPFGLPYLAIQDGCPDALREEGTAWVAAFSGGKGEFRYAVRGRRRGRHLLGPVRLETGDPFGWWRGAVEVGCYTELLVYPEVLPLVMEGWPERTPVGPLRSASLLVEDPARWRGIRSYRPEDPPRKIHWPASARGQGLMVKDWLPTRQEPVRVGFFFRREDLDRWHLEEQLEEGVVLTASLVQVLAGAGMSVSLMAWHRDPVEIPWGTGEEGLARLLSVLAVIGPGEGPPAAEALRRAGQGGAPGPVLAVVPRVDGDLLRAASLLAARGRTVQLWHLGPQPPCPPVPGLAVFSARRSGGVLRVQGGGSSRA